MTPQNKTAVTTCTWSQGDDKIIAVVRFDDKTKLWKLEVCVVEVIQDEHILVVQNDLGSSYTVEWMALERLVQLRRETLNIGKG